LGSETKDKEGRAAVPDAKTPEVIGATPPVSVVN